MTFEEWFEDYEKLGYSWDDAPAENAWDYQQSKIDQLEKLNAELIDKLKESLQWLEGCFIFISSREKMHPCGRDMHEELCKSIAELLK